MSEDKLLTPEEIASAEQHFLHNAPIAELAEFKGVTVDEAVKMRIEATLAAMPLKFEIAARPIEPMGNLIGFASVKFNNAFVVEDLKILQSDKGLFVGMPSKPDKGSKTGYRDTAKPITKEFRAELTGAVVAAYHAEVEKLQTRAAPAPTPEKVSIPKQLEKAAKEAEKANAARPKPEKSSKGKAER